MKVGIIGYGGMAKWHHHFCDTIDGIECVAAYDINPARVRLAEDKGLRGYHDLDAFLGCGLFDTVVIAAPNDVHCELSCKAMRAGKNVICEKPVALDCNQLDQMIATSKEMGVLFTVHQNRRGDKDFATAKTIVDSGMLGNICSVHSRLYGSGGVLHGWRTAKARGGGILYDWGVHFLDQILCIFGFDQVACVYAQLNTLKNCEVDDYIHLTLQMKSGLQVRIEVGTFILEDVPRWLMIGSEATACINDFEAHGNIYALRSTLAAQDVIGMTANGPTRTFAPRPEGVKLTTSLPEVEVDNLDFYRNVRDVLNGNAELIVMPEQVRAVMHVMDCLQESAKTRNFVSV